MTKITEQEIKLESLEKIETVEGSQSKATKSLNDSKAYTDQKVSEITGGALPDASIPLSKLESNVPTLDENGNVLDGNGNIVEGKVKSVNGQTGDVVLELDMDNINGNLSADRIIETDTKRFLTDEEKTIIASVQEISVEISDINTSLGDKSTLLTTEKSNIVKSINELFTNANNGKSSIANAIGLPASPSDTFSNLASTITTAKADIATTITNKGVTANSDDTFDELITKIDNIQGGEDATATSGDILANKTAVVNQQLVTGTMINQGAKIYTPTTSNQTIESGYHNGSGYVKGDSNLTASNIKSGISIFGVTGNMPSSDSATATASDILTGKTALVKGSLLTGTMANQGARTFTPGTSTQYIPAGYHNGSGYVVGNSNLIASNIKSGVSIFGVTGNYSGTGLQYYTNYTTFYPVSRESSNKVCTFSTTFNAGFPPKYWAIGVNGIKFGASYTTDIVYVGSYDDSTYNFGGNISQNAFGVGINISPDSFFTNGIYRSGNVLYINLYANSNESISLSLLGMRVHIYG